MNHPLIQELRGLLTYLARWLPVALVVGALAGTASALFFVCAGLGHPHAAAASLADSVHAADGLCG